MTDHQYVPSEGDVRNTYVDYHMRHTGRLHSRVEAEFDRFLARIRADAWDEGHVCGFSDAQDHARHIIRAPHNPYSTEESR